ncbi:MAG: FG-GAP repeat protein [Gammaproteobacteria bacterium]|nr:FG-GAP repeat protein [Gammaproteobacteria bacterium]
MIRAIQITAVRWMRCGSWRRQRVWTRWWPLLFVVLVQNAAVPGARANGLAGEPDGVSTAVSGADSRWWQTVRESLAMREYAPSFQRGVDCGAGSDDQASVLQAPNRAHGLRVCFTEGGIRLLPRVAGGGTRWPWSPLWHWSLSLSGYGVEATPTPATVGEPAMNGDRVEYARPGLTEWYQNDARGLEQGFTLHRPVGEDARGWTTLQLRMGGNLVAEMVDDRLSLRSVAGVEVLEFGHLRAFDADGLILPVTMSLRDDGLTLAVRVAGARYPVTVDPLATSAVWNVDSNQEGARLGWSLATAGDVNGDGYADLLVAAPGYDAGQVDEGRVYLYLGSAGGPGIAPAWSAEGDQAGAMLGSSVATAGDVNADGHADVIVGAPLYDAGQLDEGRVYVYLGGSGGIASSVSWTAEPNRAGARFGHAVAGVGDVDGDGYADLLVGAPGHDADQEPSQGELGRLYLYRGGANGPESVAALTRDGDQSGGGFAIALAGAGDVNGDGFADVLVAAPGQGNGDGQPRAGRVSLYLGGNAPALGVTPVWSVEGDQADAALGSAVSTAGDVNGDGHADVAVGVPGHDGGPAGAGAVLVFHGGAGGLSSTPDWQAQAAQAGARFGAALATAGDLNGDGYADLVVGAPGYDAPAMDAGRVEVYHGAATGLSAAPDWTAESDQAGAGFGQSVASAGDVDGDGFADLLVGAALYDGAVPDEGRVWLYAGAGDGPTGQSSWQVGSDQARAWFGAALAAAGDVNGDGFADVLIGAPTWDNGHAKEGGVWLYAGSAAGLASVPSWHAEGDMTDAEFGGALAGAGDVDGDGYDDILIGAVGYGDGQLREGGAFLYPGGPTGPGAQAWRAESNQARAGFGGAVAAAGDVNGDGFADVIIGASGYDLDQPDEGRAYLYLGSPGGLAAEPAWTEASGQARAFFGRAVAGAGDVDGDGYSDVLVGAHAFDDGELDEGKVWLYRGSHQGLVPGNWSAEGNHRAAAFGVALAAAGDVNGDGYGDVVIGAPFFDAGQTDEGRAFVYVGGPTGLAVSASWTAESNRTSALFGFSVSSAGDVNGDGYTDVLIGAPGIVSDPQPGRAHLYHGGPAGLGTEPAVSVQDDRAGTGFARAVTGAGDVDGDGYHEVLIGAYRFDGAQSESGRVLLYAGNQGRARPMRARARRADGSAPVAIRGQLSGSEFRLLTRGRGVFGRGRIRLEWEIKRWNQPFDGTGLARSEDWLDTGTQGVDLLALVTGLDGDGTPYRWRARVVYDPVTTPLARHGRWLRAASNLTGGVDLRNRLVDSDQDGLRDRLEASGCSDAFDRDSDDDGLLDGLEDGNGNGRLDSAETDPCNSDSDGDGIADGTELGVSVPVADLDDNGPLLATDLAVFVADADPGTTTKPLIPDSDGDGHADGVEDANHNGAVDVGESDPNDPGSTLSDPMMVPLPGAAALMLAMLIVAIAGAGRLRGRPGLLRGASAGR